MLAYMAEIFVGHAFGALAAKVAAIAVCIAVCLMLLSEANTAIVDLISIQYLMSRDGELPHLLEPGEVTGRGTMRQTPGGLP